MRYVHFKPDVAGTLPEPPGDARPRRGSAGARVAAPTGWTDDQVRRLQAEAGWRYVDPSTVQVDAALHLLNVGFVLSLPQRYTLTWARFVVEDGAAPAATPVRFVSVFPRAVYRETVFAGPILVDDDGTLTREGGDPGGTPVVPLMIGFVAADRSACWDFTPLDGRPPAASDQLILAVTKPPGHAFVPRQQLLVNIFAPGLGEVLIELPESTA